tara:strand:- start:135 stop:1001 length:867 start_codon:yes stop_codon:yes gene_type:complete
MATLTSKITLTSADLTSNPLDLSTTTTFTASHTSGLAREEIKSVSKSCKLSILDGDGANADVTVLEGQYIEITDNHGLPIKYVFADAGAAGVAADGTVIVAATDLGSQAASAIGPQIYGGRVVRIADSDTQRAILEKLRVVINSSGGHNGSISAAVVASAANGPQSTTFTNSTTGESAMFTVDAKNSTWIHVDNTYDAEATNSKADHPIIIDKDKYTAPTIYYVKNTATYHASDNIVYLYYDNHGAEDVMEVRGGQFIYLAGSNNSDLRAYTSTSGTIVEFMAVGTEA